MLIRFFVHLCLVLMFALVQTGVVTHAISHIDGHAQQSELADNENHQESNSLAEHCGQCIAYAQVDGALPQYNLPTFSNGASFELTTAYQAHLAKALTPSFSARAPPSNLNLLA